MELASVLKEKAARVKLLILDVDGVMTDGSINYIGSGEEFKSFNVKDGHGVKLLMRAGVEVAIITARSSKAVEVRAAELGIERVIQGAKEKLPAFEKLLADAGFSAEEAAYMGDDIIDLPILRRVGFSAAPSDAVAEVLSEVDLVTTRAGGKGAVREFAEALLKGSGAWQELYERYLE